MNLLEFIKLIENEDEARVLFEKLRWPHGVECPKCNRRNHSYYRNNNYSCKCRCEFSATSYTPLHKSQLPLSKWLIAIFLISSNPKIRSTDLAIYLGTGQKTAWMVRERVFELIDDEDWAHDLAKLDFSVECALPMAC